MHHLLLRTSMTQMKQAIKLPCIIVLLIMTIKVFHQLNPTFTKSNQIAEKRISYTIRSRCTLFLRPENRKPWGVHKEQMN